MPPYSRLVVTLPTFVVMALRQIAKEKRAADPMRLRMTVSDVLETWLTEFLTADGGEHLRAMTKASPELKRETEAWLRWILQSETE